ncbi:MAG: 2-oxoacid:acceptor oxidoreductase family protein [Acidimicrobiia bacterium]
MSERELMVTGMGGQGVQLAAQVIAQGATIEGRNVQLFGVYGGMMRGGNTDASVVVGDGPIQAPPVLSHTWSAIGMHDKFWAQIGPKVRDGGLVLVNDATFATELDEARLQVLRVPATDIATTLGSELGGSLVMVGAYLATTGLVGLDAAIEGMRESIPSYRTQHIAANETALRAGYDAVDHGMVPAWSNEGVPA